MGEHHRSLGEALCIRLRRRWFVYLAMSVFYCLDIYLTMLVWGRGFKEESNPISRHILLASGPGWWIVFRLAMLLVTSAALLATFALATITISQAVREHVIDGIEEVALGSVTLFYALAIFHNLMSITAPLPH